MKRTFSSAIISIFGPPPYFLPIFTLSGPDLSAGTALRNDAANGIWRHAGAASSPDRTQTQARQGCSTPPLHQLPLRQRLAIVVSQRTDSSTILSTKVLRRSCSNTCRIDSAIWYYGAICGSGPRCCSHCCVQAIEECQRQPGGVRSARHHK